MLPASVTDVVDYTARNFFTKRRVDLVMPNFLVGIIWPIYKTAIYHKLAREELTLDEGGIVLVHNLHRKVALL